MDPHGGRPPRKNTTIWNEMLQKDLRKLISDKDTIAREDVRGRLTAAIGTPDDKHLPIAGREEKV